MIRKSKGERGVAMLLVLFAMLILTAVGLAMMYMTDTETGVNSNFRSEQQAYYASKAGLEEARDRLRTNIPTAITPPIVMPNVADNRGVIYVINPTGAADPVQPWNAANRYFDDELCHENFGGLGLGGPFTPDIPCTVAPVGNNWYTTVASTDPFTNSANATSYKWVRITLKQDGSSLVYCSDAPGAVPCPNAGRQVCATQNGVAPYNPPYYETPLPVGGAPVPTICEMANMRSVYTLTSLAITPAGSRKMTQYETASIIFPPMPAAVTFDGSNPNFNPPNSNAMIVSGNDAASCGPGGPNMPAIGGYDNAAVNQIDAAIPNNRNANFTGTGGNPSIGNVNSQLGILATVGGLQSLVTNITSSANQIYGNSPNIPNLGTSASPLITVVNGDFDMGNANGAGLLLVTGNLTMSGSPNFNGAILVIGKGSLTYSGNGNGAINGAFFMANLYNGSGTLLPASSGPGVPSMSWNGGGNLSFNYDSCWVNKLSNQVVLRVLASHEQLY